MLLVNQAAANTLILTLTEKTTLSGTVYYLIRLKSDQSQEETSAILTPELSLFTYRYNQFTLTEQASTPNRTIGQVTLDPTGYWSYEIYEQNSSTNLDYTLSDNTTPIELGKCLVRIDPVAVEEYEGASLETPVYNG